MTIELQLTVQSYDADEPTLTVLRRAAADGSNVPRAGDFVAANDNWPPQAVERVVWDEDLRHVLVDLGLVDADEVGPRQVAIEILEIAGWVLVPQDESLTDPAPV